MDFDVDGDSFADESVDFTTGVASDGSFVYLPKVPLRSNHPEIRVRVVQTLITTPACTGFGIGGYCLAGSASERYSVWSDPVSFDYRPYADASATGFAAEGGALTFSLNPTFTANPWYTRSNDYLRWFKTRTHA